MRLGGGMRGADTHPFQRALLRQAQSLLCDPIPGKRRSEILELPPLNTNGAAIISLHTLTHTHTGAEEEAQTHRVKSGLHVQIRGGGGMQFDNACHNRKITGVLPPIFVLMLLHEKSSLKQSFTHSRSPPVSVLTEIIFKIPASPPVDSVLAHSSASKGDE